MLTKTSKHFLAIAFLALLAGGVYHLGDAQYEGKNDLHEIGDATYVAVMSWQGGDLLGVLIFVFLGMAALTLGIVALIARDGESAVPQDAENPVVGATYWPALTMVGVALMAMGFVSDTLLAFLGMFIVGLGALEMIVSSATDRLGGSVAENKTARDGILNPLELPVFALGLIAVPIIMLSRVFLAVESEVSVVVAVVVAGLVFGVGFLIYGTGEYNKNYLSALAAVGVVAVIVAGLISVSAGEREFERHVGPGADHQEEGFGVNSGF